MHASSSRLSRFGDPIPGSLPFHPLSPVLDTAQRVDAAEHTQLSTCGPLPCSSSTEQTRTHSLARYYASAAGGPFAVCRLSVSRVLCLIGRRFHGAWLWVDLHLSVPGTYDHTRFVFTYPSGLELAESFRPPSGKVTKERSPTCKNDRPTCHTTMMHHRDMVLKRGRPLLIKARVSPVPLKGSI